MGVDGLRQVTGRESAGTFHPPSEENDSNDVKVIDKSTGSDSDVHRKTGEPPGADIGVSLFEAYPKLKTVHKVVQEWLAPIIAYGALILGSCSFISATFFKKKFDLLDKAATGFSKASIFTTGAYGALENTLTRNTTGLVGYVSDVTVSLLASSKRLYLLRAIGSSLDQFWSMMIDFASKFSHKIAQKYSQSPTKFKNFTDFWDSTKKTLFASKEITLDTVQDLREKYNSGGLICALKSFFDVRKAERSHLFSSIGLLSCGLIATVLRYDKIIGTIRDIFGGYADFAILSKLFSRDPVTGKRTGKGSFKCGVSGAFDATATAGDCFARFIPDSNLHLLALGLSRVAGLYLVDAQNLDGTEVRNGK